MTFDFNTILKIIVIAIFLCFILLSYACFSTGIETHNRKMVCGAVLLSLADVGFIIGSGYALGVFS